MYIEWKSNWLEEHLGDKLRLVYHMLITFVFILQKISVLLVTELVTQIFNSHL
jgi:hypothetical protein